MASLRDILDRHVSGGPVPGAVGLVARGDQAEVALVGSADAAGRVPMTRDSIFRIASISKPITAAAVLMLAQDGRPLGMTDTGFEVPAAKLGRLVSHYQPEPGGGIRLVDEPAGQWSTPPAFPSGAGGVVSTADDWHSFARMLLAQGRAGGRQPLSPDSVRQLAANHLTVAAA